MPSHSPIQALPIELLRAVVDNLRSQDTDIVHLLRVSRQFYNAVAPYIYECVSFNNPERLAPLDNVPCSQHLWRYVRYASAGPEDRMPALSPSFAPPELPNLEALTLFGCQDPRAHYQKVVQNLKPKTLILRDASVDQCDLSKYLSPAAVEGIESLVLFLRRPRHSIQMGPTHIRSKEATSEPWWGHIAVSSLCEILRVIPPRLASITLTFEMWECGDENSMAGYTLEDDHSALAAFVWDDAVEREDHPPLEVFVHSLLRLCDGVIDELLSPDCRLRHLTNFTLAIPGYLLSPECRALLLGHVGHHPPLSSSDQGKIDEVKRVIHIVNGMPLYEQMSVVGGFSRLETEQWFMVADEDFHSPIYVNGEEFGVHLMLDDLITADFG